MNGKANTNGNICFLLSGNPLIVEGFVLVAGVVELQHILHKPIIQLRLLCGCRHNKLERSRAALEHEHFQWHCLRPA